VAKHLRRDLEHLEREILTVGALVEQAIHKATLALTERRPELAREVMDGDQAIDAKEVEVEEECLKILALHQPVASDLRYIIAVLKVNNDLERMGDLAINVAERAIYIAKRPALPVRLDFELMVQKVRGMVRESLDALVNQDAALARRVNSQDDEVDRLNAEMFDVLQRLMQEDPSTTKRAVHSLSASRHLERIADLATNIAEDVVFMVEGEVVRHRFNDYVGEGEGGSGRLPGQRIEGTDEVGRALGARDPDEAGRP